MDSKWVSSGRVTGRPNNARARSTTTASASSAITQVNRRRLQNTSLNPSGFFSKAGAGSIHGRTCCNTCCAHRLAAATSPATARAARVDTPIAAGRCPTAAAEFRFGPDAKPVSPSPTIVAQPRQRFARRAGRRIPRHIGRHQFPVTPEHGQHRHAPPLPAWLFGGGPQIPQVGHDQRHQRHLGQVMVPPPAERVFLVADETATRPGLERASAQRGVRGGVWPGAFFGSRHWRPADRGHRSVPPPTAARHRRRATARADAR